MSRDFPNGPMPATIAGFLADYITGPTPDKYLPGLRKAALSPSYRNASTVQYNVRVTPVIGREIAVIGRRGLRNRYKRRAVPVRMALTVMNAPNVGRDFVAGKNFRSAAGHMHNA